MSDIENIENILRAGDDADAEEQSERQEADEDDEHVPVLDFDALNNEDRSSAADGQGSNLEWLDEEVSDEVVEANTILVPKNRRGIYGSRDYLRNLDAATATLDPKMGVPSHFVSSRDGETESGNETEDRLVQEVFVSNHDKLMQAMLRAEHYDMMGIFMVPSIVNKYARKPNDIFDMTDSKNMFLHWDAISWENVCQWQKTLNKWAGPDDRTSSRWAQSFLYKSSTLELRERVASQYDKLPANFKGGATYLYLQLKVMFHMSRDTISALKQYLKQFEERGLRGVRGENVAVAEKEINVVCSRLSEVKALPAETIVDVLTGLTNCSVPDFTKLFDFVLQAARVDALDLNTDSSGDPLAEIKRIMSKAVEAYHALCTAGKWHVEHTRLSLIVCWNCGEEGHTCQNCKKPWDQAAIDKGKKKFYDEKNGGGARKKWGVKPEAIAPISESEGDDVNPTDDSSVSPASSPVEDASKVVVDKERAAAVLKKLEGNTTSDETIEIVAAIRTVFHLD